MRCRYCGSSVIHHANEYKDFSVGKAIAGTVVFGPIGAVAGVTGKKISGFRCSQCGEFMERPMETTTEQMVNDAIYNAKKGSSYSMYGYYKKQYPNIEEVDYKEQASVKTTERFHSSTNVINSSSIEADSMKMKRRYYYGKWDPESPIFIEHVIIESDSTGDFLSFVIWNQSEQKIRSLYLQASVYDDAGDILNTSRCVYQGVNVEPGGFFPLDKAFRLDTDLAYRVDVQCEKVVFTSDDVWRVSDEAVIYQLEETDIIDRNVFPRYRYLVEAYKDISKKGRAGSLHVPLEREEYWRCLCGLPVKSGKPCPRCGCGYEDVQKICAQSFLEKVQHDAVINKAAERAKKTQEGFDQAKEKINSEVYKFAAQYKAEGTVESLSKAVEMFGQISTYKDAANKAEECQNLITSIIKTKEEEKRAREETEKAREKAAEEKAKKLRTGGVIAAFSIIAIIAIVLTITKVIIPGKAYNEALALKEDGHFDEAVEAFEALNGYKDSESQIKECERAKQNAINEENYIMAMHSLDNREFEIAAERFHTLGAYKDSKDKYLEAVNGINYEKGIEKTDQKLYEEAINIFSEIQDYSDSSQRLEEIYSLIIKGAMDGDEEIYNLIKDVPEDRIYKDARSIYEAAKYQLDNGNYRIAKELFGSIKHFEESNDYYEYAHGKASIEEGLWQAAIESFSNLRGFLDSEEQLKLCKHERVFKGNRLSIEEATELLSEMDDYDAKELLSLIKEVNKCSGKFNGSKLQNKGDLSRIGDWSSDAELEFFVYEGKIKGTLIMDYASNSSGTVSNSDKSDYRYMLKSDNVKVYFNENNIKADPQINGGIFLYYYSR